MPKLLATPVTVAIDRIIDAIEKFNLGGCNPYGPNVPVMGHSPLLFSLAGANVEFPFYAVDRPAETTGHQTIRTRHPVLYPMTRTMIMRQWHRVYAFDVLAGAVTGVKLLVDRRQDPELFVRHPDVSAHPWVFAVKNSLEPVALDAP